MIGRTLRSGLVIAALLTFLAACTVQFRSPIKISRNKEEKKESPPKEVVYAPAQQPPSEQVPVRQVSPTVSPETRHYQPAIATRQTASPENITIISEYYLSDSHYEVLGNISVRDVSGDGFTEKDARRALQNEAFHRFGSRATAITNLSYQKKESWLGADTIKEASGDVISWPGAPMTAPQAKAAPAPTSAESPREPYTMPPAERPEQPAETRAVQSYQAPTAGTPPPPSAYRAPEGAPGVSSPAPAAVLILSDQDLVNYRFWVVGKISVYSKSGDGFGMEEANAALRAEAFRRYGTQARGIINTAYKEKKGLFNWWGGSSFSEASGDVVNWGEQTTVAHAVAPAPIQVQERPVSLPAAPEALETHSFQPPPPSPHPQDSLPPAHAQPAALPMGSTPANILVVSPEGLINKDFQFLGKIQVRDSSHKGFDEKKAAEALKVEAYKRYGAQARAITNLQYLRKTGLIYYKKYEKASADVITWGTVEDATPPTSAATVASASPYYASTQGEAIPEYTTGASSYEDIRILKENDLLHDHYETLGTIEYQSPNKQGVRTYEADIALQREAFNTYKDKARAIINIEYVKAAGPHSTSNRVVKAKGNVITW